MSGEIAVIEKRILRQLIFEALRNSKSISLSDNSTYSLRTIAIKKGILDKSNEALNPNIGRDPNKPKVFEIIWELFLQGIILPKTIGSGGNIHTFYLTDYGMSCIQENRLLPHDPEGYLNELLEKVPELDTIVKFYIEESLSAFNSNCPTASTVMLGVASEKLILDLIDSFLDFVDNPEIRKKLEKIHKIKPKFETFKTEFNKRKGTLDKKLVYDFENSIDRVFDIIRQYRNDSGHPTGIKISKPIANQNLWLFIPYLASVYKIINYFKDA